MVRQNPENSAGLWNEIFEAAPDGIPDRVLSETISLLHDEQLFDAAVEGLLAAIRHDHAQPWMYDVLAAEMKLAGRPPREIARVIASRVDFAVADVPQMLLAVAMLSRFEAYDAANELAREATELNPELPEAWLLGRSVADKSGSLEHRVRTRCGILTHVWSGDFMIHHEEARTVLLELAMQAPANSVPDRSAIEQRLQSAAQVDVQVLLRWVGDADLDLSLTEPGGEVCDFRRPLTMNRGRLIQTTDLSADPARDASRKGLEHYVCHSAPNGRYTATVRFVVGRAAGGTAVVEIIRNAGTPDEARESRPLKLSDQASVIEFDITEGRGSRITGEPPR
jgi:hypothetical protein